jgi:hypothetical protein
MSLQIIIFSFFFDDMGFELRTLYLLGKCSWVLVYLSTQVVLGFDKFLHNENIQSPFFWLFEIYSVLLLPIIARWAIAPQNFLLFT